MKERILSDSEVRTIQLEILDDVTAFCQANNIRFMLAYGTLLGAVRHKGYIPWDDDIDLAMPRPDYDRFLTLYSSSQNTALDLAQSGVCIEMFAKVSRNGTRMKDHLLGRSLWGVNIDIFPIDGIPDDSYRDYYRKMEHLYDKVPQICPFYKVVGHHKVKWFLKYWIKRIIHPYPGSCTDLKQVIVDKLRNFGLEQSKRAGAYFGDDKEDEFLPVYIFSEYTYLTFERRILPCPLHYNEYLSALYGDFMKLPPEEKRVSHHDYTSFIAL